MSLLTHQSDASVLSSALAAILATHINVKVMACVVEMLRTVHLRKYALQVIHNAPTIHALQVMINTTNVIRLNLAK